MTRSLLVVAVGVGVAGADVPWTNHSGDATFFTWENGGSVNGLYGDPTLVGGNAFVFFPDHFRAEAVDGGQQTTNDTFYVDLIARPGQSITGVRIQEFGDYGIEVGGSVDLAAELSATNLNGGGGEIDTMTTDLNFPVQTSGEGSYMGTAEVEILAGGWQRVRMEFSNNLIAIADAGGTAFIQ
ncbi:MAG: hypothetical protein KDA28_08895, partial [Phycisphaerales bacterium]|nr:hypothetical protein [Phycisphaerales bacterium]